MLTKKEAYNENVDQLLTLMNKAKELGYNFSFQEMAKMTGIDLNNLQLYNAIDLVLIASVNKTYANNENIFKDRIENYINNKVVKA